MRRKSTAAEELPTIGDLPRKGGTSTQIPQMRSHRQLWCALVFPDLSLEASLPRSDSPAAVSDTNGKKIIASNLSARDSGVYPGQTCTAAIVVCPELRVAKRNVQSEKLILSSIAGLVQEFSPQLICEEESIAFEISGSLRLFGGIEQLISKIRNALGSCRIRYEMAISPTILSALWRARASRSDPILSIERLPAAMGSLPIDVMEIEQKLRLSLLAVGIETLADLMRLPRAGTARRYGRSLVDRVDRAMGWKPDPRSTWKAPQRFEESLDFCETGYKSLLDQAISELSDRLSCFLCERQLAVRRWSVAVRTDLKVYEVNLESYRPISRSASIVWMVSHWMEGIRLDSPARHLVFRAQEFVPLNPEQGLNFFSDREQGHLGVALDGIRARFGSEAIVRVCMSPDHRPEQATRRVILGSCQGNTVHAPKRWPLFLLPKVVNLHAGLESQVHGEGMKIIDGPERIESGWWDGNDVARDYYRVRLLNGSELWVFNDLRSGNWYLQGYFL